MAARENARWGKSRATSKASGEIEQKDENEERSQEDENRKCRRRGQSVFST